MIISNRRFPFGSKVAIIHTASFVLTVTTAKEGFFKKQSTMISEGERTVFGGKTPPRPCGKIIYSPSLRKTDRLQFHDAAVQSLDSLGEAGISLREGLELLFKDFMERGIAIEAINIA